MPGFFPFRRTRLPALCAAPFAEIARKTELPLETVLERIRDMLEAGTIRRVRQTLLADKPCLRRARCLEGSAGEARCGL